MTDEKPEMTIEQNPGDAAEAKEAAAPGEIFDNLLAVLQYLKDHGWQTARQSLYRHRDQGKLVADQDGKFRQRAVDKYAKTFLKQVATGKRVQQKNDELQREKLELELKNLKIKNDREQFNYDRIRGQYVQREQMEIELATRASILDAGLKHWIQSRAAEWIRISSGDIKRTGELVNSMIKDLNEHMNDYASPMEFEVVISGDEYNKQNIEKGEME